MVPGLKSGLATPQGISRRAEDPDAPEPALAAEEIRVKCTKYWSVPHAVESDHKPVLARLAISMPVTDQVRL